MTEKHTHKLKRITYKSGNSTFFCVLDCKFKISPQLALGKKCICWRCGNEFFLNEYALRLAKPHCDNCHKPKKFERVVDGDMTIMKEISISPIVTITPITEPTLAERLQQTINQRQQTPEEEEI